MEKLLPAIFLLVAGTLLASMSSASAAPTAITLRLVVPTPAGTAADLMARILAEHMGPTLGANVVVENKPGASGVIAVESLLQSSATRPAVLLAGLDHIVYGPAALGRKSWDPLTDFKPVGLVNNDRWVLVGSSVTAGDLASLARTSKERPVRCANQGLGSTQHAICAWAAKRLGVTVDHIPYSQPFMSDLIGGRVDMAAVPIPGAAAALSAGRIKGLMLLSRERHSSFATIPASAELGQHDLIFESGLALYASAGVSENDIDLLHDALQRAQRDETVRKRFVGLGVDPAPASRAESTNQLRVRIQLNDAIRQEAFGQPR